MGNPVRVLFFVATLIGLVDAKHVNTGSSKEELLIGWQGEVPRPVAGHEEESPSDAQEITIDRYHENPLIRGGKVESRSGIWLEQLSWEPRAYLAHNLLTKQECKHLIKLASKKIEPSQVIDEHGEAKLDSIRTSWSTVLETYESPDVLKRVNDKVAAISMLPAENGETIQVLRYEDGQKYDAHWDQFDTSNAEQRKHMDQGQRVATVLIYLSDVERGGETVFPMDSKWLPDEDGDEPPYNEQDWSPCGGKALKGQHPVAVHPREGDAVLFWGLTTNAQKDMASMHAGCPVLAGTKWTATKWLHDKAIDYNIEKPRVLKRGECRDLNDHCVKWATEGECEANPGFMIGDNKFLKGPEGQCMMSCNACPTIPGTGTKQSKKSQVKQWRV